MTSIVSPRLLSSLLAFYPSACTIQQATENQDAFGQPIPTWQNLPGHVDIPCVIAPVPIGKGEIKRADQTIVVSPYYVMLAGQWPAIRESHRVVSGGTVYDIVQIAHDQMGLATRLTVQVVS